jgi:hypothetical protein
MEAISVTWADVAAEKAIDADVVVFPSRYLGELCVRQWLRPVRSNVLGSKELNAEDYFPLVRQQVIRWGGEVMALPLGVDPRALCQGPLAPSFPRLFEFMTLKGASQEWLDLFFESESMRPRIAEPPFVDALSQLVQSDQDAAVNETGDARQIPLLGYSDPLAAVTTVSRNAATAFKLLEWLALPETSARIGAAPNWMLPARRSVATSGKWSSNVSEEEDERAALRSMNNDACFMIPRLPGVDDYMEALNEAVHAALSEDALPEAVLQKAAERWEEITDAHGRDAQRAAYLKHLGFRE